MAKWLELKNSTEYDDTVISSRIRLARNLFVFKFPKYISKDEAKDVSDIIINAINRIDPDEEFSINAIKNLNSLDKRVLVEEHIISSELVDNQDISYYITNEKNNINLMINEEDHLRIQVLYPGFELYEGYELARELDDKLEKYLSFAFDMDFGYLTSCPTNAGTGMRASSMLHLPGLKYSGLIEGFKDSLGKLGIAVRGVYGEGSVAIGDMYQISNQKTIGFSEMEIIDKLDNIIIKIIHEERNARLRLMEEKSNFIKDKIFRALGILKYSRIIDSIEALNNLSLVRMGIYLNLYNKLSYEKITNLMFAVQKFNILKYKNSIRSARDENILRADFIRNFFEREEIK